MWIRIKLPSEPSPPCIPKKYHAYIEPTPPEDSKEFKIWLKELIRSQKIQSVDFLFQKKSDIKVSEDFKRWFLQFSIQLKAWYEEFKKWKKTFDFYVKFYDMHQELIKLGEEYELVIGFGLLSWKLPNNQLIKRHLVTVKVNLEFYPQNQEFIIFSELEPENVKLEEDMIDLEFQPPGIMDFKKKMQELNLAKERCYLW